MLELCGAHRVKLVCAPFFAVAAVTVTSTVFAQTSFSATEATTESVAFLDGVWIGPATMTLPDGKTLRFEQMERVGPMMNGEVRIMEGKGRDASGKSIFNAFTVFSQNADKSIEMRSYTMGHASSRKLDVRDGKGFVWELRVDESTIRYTATVADGIWSEIGERIGPDGRSLQFFEMTLKRVSDTNWPADNPAFPTQP